MIHLLKVVFATATDFSLVTSICVSVCIQVYSQHSSLLSCSPQRSSLGSEGESERQFNLNDNSVPTATQALMTMYRRRSPEEFNPKLVNTQTHIVHMSHMLKHLLKFFFFFGEYIFIDPECVRIKTLF